MRNKTKNQRKRNRNPDRVTANQIDPVAYHEFSAMESLDDEIDNWERFASSMPFGGEDEPIRGFGGHTQACAYGCDC